MAPFERLVRFETDGGIETYGDLPSSVGNDDIVGSSVEVLDGDMRSGFKKSGSKATIKKVGHSQPAETLSPPLTLPTTSS